MRMLAACALAGVVLAVAAVVWTAVSYAPTVARLAGDDAVVVGAGLPGSAASRATRQPGGQAVPHIAGSAIEWLLMIGGSALAVLVVKALERLSEPRSVRNRNAIRR